MAAVVKTIRIGYVPEHYLLPLHLSLRHLPPSLKFDLIPFPSGTGHMITSLRHPNSHAESIDLAIGLTEAWIAGLLPPNLASGSKKRGYNLVGQWVLNPLRWAIVTGKDRKQINTVADLGRRIKADGGQGKLKVGVSRMGSGSHVMASVLAQQEGWDQNGLEFVKCGPFAQLRDAVNKDDDIEGGADFFMWEHFTTKPWFQDDSEKLELKRIGEIYTPWPSWCVAASDEKFPDPDRDEVLGEVLKILDQGIEEFEGDRETGLKMLGTGEAGCHYSDDDASEWAKKAEFQTTGVRGVERKMVEGVVEVLMNAGVVKVEGTKSREVDDILVIER